MRAWLLMFDRFRGLLIRNRSSIGVWPARVPITLACIEPADHRRSRRGGSIAHPSSRDAFLLENPAALAEGVQAMFWGSPSTRKNAQGRCDEIYRTLTYRKEYFGSKLPC